jgi:phosphoribosylformimino-5-aminoimidazole carboxamide ribonucleotide (ProFAR) isomerase
MGGGIRSKNDAIKLLQQKKKGNSRYMAIENPDIITELSSEFGRKE